MKRSEKETAAPNKRCLEEWLERLFAPRSLAVLLTVVYVVGLIPVLWIAGYNFPSADDYTNGSACYHVWQTSGSVFAVLKEAFSRAVSEWFSWRGCYTSSFLSALPPNVWGEGSYFLTTWLVLFMLSFSTVYLLRMILVKGLHGDGFMAHSIAMLVLLITVQCLYRQGRVEAFYWYSGAINYTFMHGVSLLFYGLMIDAALSHGKGRGFKLVVAALLGFLTAGGNQMTMLNAAIVLFAAAAGITLLKKWKQYHSLLFPMGVFFAGFVLSVAAPGNLVRAEGASGMNPVKAVFVSLYSCLDLAVDEWTTFPLLLMLAVMVPLFWKLTAETEFTFPYPLLVVLFGYGLVSAMVTPPLFALGNIEAGRLQSMLFFMYVLVLCLCTGYVTGWFRKRLGGAVKREDNGRIRDWFLFGCFGFLLFGSVLTIIPEPDYYTASSAVFALLDESAQTYGKEQKERTFVYLQEASKSVSVKELTKKPELLFFSDITEDEGDWKNKGVARYYGLEAVKIDKE